MKRLFFVIVVLFAFTMSLSAADNGFRIFRDRLVFNAIEAGEKRYAYLVMLRDGAVEDTFGIVDSLGNIYWKYLMKTDSMVVNVYLELTAAGYAKFLGTSSFHDSVAVGAVFFVYGATDTTFLTPLAVITSYAEHDSISTGKLKVKLDVSQITDTLAHIQADTSGIDRNVTGLLINGESINNASDFPAKFEDKDGNVLFSVKGDGAVEGLTLNKQFSYQCAGDIFNIAPNSLALLGWITPVTTEQDLSPHNNDFDYHNFAISDRTAKGLVWKLRFPTDPANGYLHALDSDDFSFDDEAGANGFTMGGWHYVVTTASDSQTIWSKWDETTALPLREWRMYIGADEKLVMMLYDESVDKMPFRTSDAAIPVGWHLMLAVYDGGGGNTAQNGITLYVDGIVEASTGTAAIGYVGMENTNTYVFVGAIEGAAGTNKDHWQGDMGHQFITTDQLTADENWELYLRTRGYYNE